MVGPYGEVLTSDSVVPDNDLRSTKSALLNKSPYPCLARFRTEAKIRERTYSVWLPSHTSLKVLAQRDMIVQEFQEIFTFFLLKTDNVSGELWVDVQSLLAGSGMCTDNRMDRPGDSQTEDRPKRKYHDTYETGFRRTVPFLSRAAFTCS